MKTINEKFDEEFGHVFGVDKQLNVSKSKSKEIKAFIRKEMKAMADAMMGTKKRLDVGGVGAVSASFPSGEIWTQEKRIGYNKHRAEVKSIRDKYLSE